MLKYVKHLLIISGLLSLPILLFSGCLKEGNDTIVLPLPDGKIPYSVIPEQLQDSLRTHGLTIHEGVNPGNIDGRFLSSPMVLHYSSDNYQELFYDLYMSFSGQKPRGMVKYSETQKHEYIDGKSYMANVIGEGNDVTMYCLQNVFECSSSGDTLWKSRTATVVSGTLCECNQHHLRITIKKYEYEKVIIGSNAGGTGGIAVCPKPPAVGHYLWSES